MKTFEKQAAQGDMLIFRLDDDWTPPDNAEKVKPEDGVYIVGHSETGHHHVIDRAATKTTTMYRLPDSIYDAFITVGAPTSLDHERPFDTHESIALSPGNYHIKRQREYTPEGYRRVAD